MGGFWPGAFGYRFVPIQLIEESQRVFRTVVYAPAYASSLPKGGQQETLFVTIYIRCAVHSGVATNVTMVWLK